jgi:hypothetical protein
MQWPGGSEENHVMIIRIVASPAEIQTGYLRNTGYQTGLEEVGCGYSNLK